MYRKRFNTFLKFSFFFLLTVFLLWFSFKDAHMDELLAGLRAANYSWVLVGVLLGIAAYFVRALRWRMLIEPLGYRPSLASMYNAVIMGYLANLIFPRFGEVVRCGALVKSDKIPLNKLVGTVVAERAFDMLCLISIVLLAFLLRMDTFGRFLRENVFQKLAEKEIFSGGLFVLLAAAAVALVAALIWAFRSRLRKSGMAQKIWKFIKGIGDGLKTFLSMERRWNFLLHSVLLWLCYWGMSWVVLFAIPATSSFGAVDGLVVMLLGSFGVVAPTNGGLGAFHAITSIGLYAIYAIPETDGLLYATLAHESQMLFVIILGIVAYVQLFLF
ncbi:MAG: flippase-like domain-containing protein, partial [Prevotellaceae bacterium]|nr:flippase-like domain-containing protein [Prevotellaceae bacterium]